MTYKERIAPFKNFSAKDAIDIAWEMLPAEHRRAPWACLNHGVDLLETESQLSCYMAAYGEMHERKCRVALQNFDYENLASTIEVIDWGCGQGIATLTLIDILRERNQINLLRRVTLVEPSLHALERAQDNVKQSTQDSIPVQCINRYLPGTTQRIEVEGVHYECETVIHLFSNILDIPSVSLTQMANMITQGGIRTHWIAATCPCHKLQNRIDDFTSFFNLPPEQIKSSITDNAFGYTESTHHPYSCKAKSFIYQGAELSIPGYKEKHYDGYVENDYDEAMLERNSKLSKAEITLFKRLQQVLQPEERLYIHPEADGREISFAIVNKAHGLTAIQCHTESISVQVKGKETWNECPSDLVKKFCNSITNRCLKDGGCDDIWKVTNKFIFLARNSISDAQKYNREHKNITAISHETKDADLRKMLFPYGPNRFMNEGIFDVLSAFMSLGWHSYLQGIPRNLTREQLVLAKSEEGMHRKIAGIAGCGKTQVLAEHAVNSYRRTGEKVLILCYNAALINNIRLRLKEVRADFPWNKFRILTYHQFVAYRIIGSGQQYHLGDEDNVNIFNGRSIDEMHKYRTILIDEVQNFKEEWLRIIQSNFLALNGEFLVFGDPKQNIFSRSLDTNGDIRLGLIPGTWNNSLNKAFRFTNGVLTTLADRFKNEYIEKVDYQTIQQMDIPLGYCIKYMNLGKSATIENIISNIMSFIADNEIDVTKTAVLSQCHPLLRLVDDVYKKQTGSNTTLTFETQQKFEQLYRENYNADKKQLEWPFKSEIDSIHKTLRYRFTMDTPYLKMSTVHSFIGWEAETVILVIQPTKQEQGQLGFSILPEFDIPEIIYTALTRARSNLFVINLGNSRYDSFFKRNI